MDPPLGTPLLDVASSHYSYSFSGAFSRLVRSYGRSSAASLSSPRCPRHSIVLRECISVYLWAFSFGLVFFFFPSTNRVCRFGSRCRFLCKRISRAFFGSKAWQLAILCQQRTDLPFVPASRHILSSRLSSSSPRLSSSLLELSSFPRASEGRFGGEVERGLVYTTRETRYPPWWRVYRIDSVLVNFRRKEKILKGSRFIILCFRKEDAQMEFLVKESEEEYLRDDK